jgi:broad specificity phosphatase PhoE
MNVVATRDVWLIRHGETEWTVSRRHTGLTNLPLTAAGEQQARALRGSLQMASFARVLYSPLQRAALTCELAGYGMVAEVDKNLVEWNYGDYEGKRRPAILADRPDWIIFQDGCPNGESPVDVAIRADRVISRIRTTPGNVAVFSNGHFLRVFIARWLGFDASAGRYFKLGTGALTILGYDHDSPSEPVIRLLNEQPRSDYIAASSDQSPMAQKRR